jgi:hypothetical protein
VGAVTVHFLTAGESRWQNLKMQASGQRVQVFKAHLRDWYAKLASFIFSDLARDYLAGWQAVYGKAYDVVDCTEFLRVVI